MYRPNVKISFKSFVLALLAVPLLALTVGAQVQTTAFTYQGRLTDAGAPANANYDLQFTLWDALSGGTQQPQPAPAALTKPNVAVTGGVFIQNTTGLQLNSNFNISGNGTAGGTLSGDVVNSATQYNIGGNRVLSAPGTNNLFAGRGAGQANTFGVSNTFVGTGAGQAN